MWICRHCSHENHSDSSLCHHCHVSRDVSDEELASLMDYPPETTKKSRYPSESFPQQPSKKDDSNSLGHSTRDFSDLDSAVTEKVKLSEIGILEDFKDKEHLVDRFIGKTVGDFAIIERIGKGASGIVYKAQRQKDGLTVAIKILRPERENNPELLQRFQREARALARLQHEYIVKLEDFGILHSGGFYLAMEYLEGETLKELIEKRQEPLSIEEIKELIGQICLILDYIHKKGILHRDMKTSNILITTNEQGYRIAKLIDFGLASILDETSSLTVKGAYLGSPLYMPPEQGYHKKLDERSDLYSLGIILYQLLTGKYPFTGNNVTMLLAKHFFQPPPRLAESYPQKEWAEELEQFVQKALAKEKKDRPSSALEFLSLCLYSLSAQEELEKSTFSPTQKVKNPLLSSSLQEGAESDVDESTVNLKTTIIMKEDDLAETVKKLTELSSQHEELVEKSSSSKNFSEVKKEEELDENDEPTTQNLEKTSPSEVAVDDIDQNTLQDSNTLQEISSVKRTLPDAFLETSEDKTAIENSDSNLLVAQTVSMMPSVETDTIDEDTLLSKEESIDEDTFSSEEVFFVTKRRKFIYGSGILLLLFVGWFLWRFFLQKG